MEIKKFNEIKTLYVFDFDDTLADTPSFQDLVKPLLENVSIKDLLDLSLKSINRDISDLEYENGRIYVSDPNGDIKISRNWVRKKDRVYLTAPDIYSKIDQSLPVTINPEIVSIYKKVENKCIITARPVSIKGKIINKLKEFDLNIPKYGVHLKPDDVKNAGRWKGLKMLELIEKYDFNRIVFYDDNSKVLKKAKRAILEKLPSYDIKLVKVNL
jgi:hypothetical protein